MKNLKNTVSAAALMVVLGFGAVSANAGILMSDRTNNQSCSGKDSLFNQLSGVIFTGSAMLDGIIVAARTGILMSDRKACESNKAGIIVAARDGILIND